MPHASIGNWREIVIFKKFLPIKSIKPNGFSYHLTDAMMLSDSTKSAPHQVTREKKRKVTFMPALSGLFFTRKPNR
jgi:hypothetical protein